MRSDIIDLKDFYSRRLGTMVQRVVSAHLREMWPNVRGQSILGVGYASPFLAPFRAQAGRVLNVMPAQQGVSRWPVGQPNASVLVDEHLLPLPDSSIDLILLVHGLEVSENVQPMLRELWRVLTARGRLMVVAPNRTGLWAQAEGTPFGQGHPYTRGQLMSLMRDQQLEPQVWKEALFMPPVELGFVLRSARAWEKIGSRIWPFLPGLHILEVSKQIYAVPAERKKLRVLRPVPVAQPGLVGSMREKDPE